MKHTCMLSHVHFVRHWSIGMYVPLQAMSRISIYGRQVWYRCISVRLHTTHELHFELLHAAYRFGVAWYERKAIHGNDPVIHCTVSSPGSLRDSWKPIGDFIKVIRTGFWYVPPALSLPTYSLSCIVKVLDRNPFVRYWTLTMHINL